MQEEANLQLYFLLSRHLSLLRVSPIFPTRSALHTNTVRVGFTNTAQIPAEIQIQYSSRALPCSPYDCPVLPQLPKKTHCFLPKNYPQTASSYTHLCPISLTPTLFDAFASNTNMTNVNKNACFLSTILHTLAKRIYFLNCSYRFI